MTTFPHLPPGADVVFVVEHWADGSLFEYEVWLRQAPLGLHRVGVSA